MTTDNLEQYVQKELEPAFYYSKDGVPVFKPTMEQFRDFNQFVTQVDKYGAISGIVKIIPPAEWRNEIKNIPQSRLESISFTTAIRQHFSGSSGVYTCANVLHRKKLTLRDWKKLSQSELHRTPTYVPKIADFNDGRVNAERLVLKKRRIMDEDSQLQSITSSKSSLSSSSSFTTTIELINIKPQVDQSSDSNSLMSSSFPDDPAYYEELEAAYWRNITQVGPYYGADIQGSLQDEDLAVWNIGKLDNLLNHVKQKLPGVNTPYLYFGMWKSTFSWHVEDMDLYSINYIHFGAPKHWYVVPCEYHEQFKKVAKQLYPQASSGCSEFLRHKTFMISPQTLEKYGIPVNKCVQKEGEIILTFPHGYHSGFNMGYNCAESVNFALPRWLQIGAYAQSCSCVQDSVKIDVEAVFNVRIKPISKEMIPVSDQMCILCGQSSDQDELLPIQDDSRQFDYKMAHRSCAIWIAETYTAFQDNVESVYGIGKIPKARWRLRCKFCSYRKGACIQCASPKCYTAFHYKCAVQNDLFTTSEMMQLEDDDTGELEDVEVPQCYCRRHSPAVKQERLQKQVEHEILVQTAIDRYCSGSFKQLPAQQQQSAQQYLQCKCKYGPTWYEASVIQDFRDRKQCQIRFSSGHTKIVSYREVQLID
ncbi:hypothetical protein MP228_007991 [Amoeboaphelidium protococcarum]|nr:hypothetical protein MP228_007991 [Amoeboaphelidium protococcarum]